jgi:acetyl esterase/lipase
VRRALDQSALAAAQATLAIAFDAGAYAGERVCGARAAVVAIGYDPPRTPMEADLPRQSDASLNGGRRARRIGLLALLWTCAVAAQTRGPLELATADVPPGAVRISYGKDPLQFGELRVPAGKGPHPVAIVVHGGCWVARLGTMSERAVAIDNMRPLSAALTAAGIATWNIEYRRLGHPGGGWPGTFQDVAQAADFVRTLAKSHPLDLTRVAAIGHSAGGHLVTWLAARAKLPRSSELHTSDPLPLSGAVNLDGPADLRAALAIQQPICGSPVITNLLGGSPDERPDRYRAASPIELLPIGVRQELLAGRMFGSQVARYEVASKNAGDMVHATVLADAGHFVFIDPQSDVWPQVLAAVRRLLTKPE